MGREVPLSKKHGMPNAATPKPEDASTEQLPEMSEVT